MDKSSTQSHTIAQPMIKDKLFFAPKEHLPAEERATWHLNTVAKLAN
jgi:hypothetical protein